jgi:GMP synthase-like glutamine amidotransferase
MQNKIVILDFGSQYTQLIARRVRSSMYIVKFILFFMFLN